MDEVSFKRHHTYATVLCNQRDSRVIWLERDRTQESLEKIYTKFCKHLSHLISVSMDFWQPYEAVTKRQFPSIYDRFHLSRILNRHIEQERRTYQKLLSDKERIVMKKHTRWLLLRRKDNQTAQGLERLQELRKTNRHLYMLLKEDFLSMFDTEISHDKARQYILEWIAVIEKTRFDSLKSFCKKVMNRLDIILNWFVEPLSNGLAEGINNVIKSLLKCT